MQELTEGVKLKSVVGPADTGGGQLWFRLGAESHQCKEIVVSMENGQMAGVPWAKATKNSGEVVMANLALMECVELMGEE